MPKISIIVPVYNTEKYIHRCIDSILNQTFKDFELILVDDGSPDNCGVICDEYSIKDSRIRVIHQENHGASAARNRGLDCAKGDYIAFCDSDDMVSPQWLEHLLGSAVSTTLPICGFCHDDSKLGKRKDLPVLANAVLQKADYFTFACCGIGGYMWNSLYDNHIIQNNHLRLREQKEQGDYNEDLLFNLQYIRYVKNIVYVGYADYLYDLHEDSLSRGNQKYYFEKYAEKYALWESFLKENHREEQLPQLASQYLFHFLNALNDCTYRRFEEIVLSEVLQSCVHLADSSKENPQIITDIKNGNVLKLWFRYQIHKLKGWFV